MAEFHPSITTKRDGRGDFGPRYRVLIDGRATSLCIEKSVKPRYGQPQLWDVFSDAYDTFLFDAKSLSGAIGAVSFIINLAHGGR